MAKRSQSIQCALPSYQTDRKAWRRRILACARAAVADPSRWDPAGPFEVIVLLYLSSGKQFGNHDVDNRLKDVLDGLQGAFHPKQDSKVRAEDRLIKNDSSVYRVVVEKQVHPKKYKNKTDPPGGRLLVRSYKRHGWPLAVARSGA